MTQSMSEAPALDPVTVPAGEGEARWWFGGLAVVKATARDTGGQMTILEVTEPANEAGPLHVHHTEDEGFWILGSSATFEVGDQTIEARAPATTCSGRGTSRIATRQVRTAAGCCSSSPRTGSRSC